MKPPQALDGKLLRVKPCDQAREWLNEACDERRTPDGGQHQASCLPCAREAALMKDLEQLLASEPPVDPPPELLPSVMQLVRADLARARRNARLALAGAVLALVLLAC